MSRLQHQYQFYNGTKLFYKRLFDKHEGIIDLKNDSIIMNNKFDVNIENDFKKLNIALMLHRINRKGYGRIGQFDCVIVKDAV